MEFWEPFTFKVETDHWYGLRIVTDHLAIDTQSDGDDFKYLQECMYLLYVYSMYVCMYVCMYDYEYLLYVWIYVLR